MIMAAVLDQLQKLRNKSGKSQTVGLSDSLISKFSDLDPLLCLAVEEAVSNQDSLVQDFGEDILKMDEVNLITLLQNDYVNFYSKDTINPYTFKIVKTKNNICDTDRLFEVVRDNRYEKGELMIYLCVK